MREQLIIRLVRDVHFIGQDNQYVLVGGTSAKEDQLLSLQKAASVVYTHRKPGDEEVLFEALNQFEAALVTSQLRGVLTEDDTQRLVCTVQMIRDKE